MKHCNTCDTTKPHKDFCRNRRTKDGLNHRCRQCSADYDKSYNEKNRATRLAYKRNYNRQNREKIAAYNASRADKQREYYQENKERIKSYHKRKRIADKEHVRRTLESDLYQRLKYLWKGRRTHAKKKNIVFDVSVDDLVDLHNEQSGCCALTGTLFEMSREHDYRAAPLAPSIDRINPRDGYTRSNIQLVCFMVNMGKSEYPQELFDMMCRARVEMLDRG